VSANNDSRVGGEEPENDGRAERGAAAWWERGLLSLFPPRMPIRWHFVGLFSLTTACILILSGLLIYSVVYENMRRNMMEKLAGSTVAIKDVVEQAAQLAVRSHLQAIAHMNIDMLDGLERQVHEGRLSRDAAMQLAKERLLTQHVGERGYVAAMTGAGSMVAHSQAPNISTGPSLSPHLRQQVTLKNGYLEQEWQAADEAAASAKGVYLAYFQPWDWIIAVVGVKHEFTVLLDDLRHGLRSQHFGNTGYAFIVNSQGDIILHPWLIGNVHRLSNQVAREVFTRILSMKNGQFSYLWDEENGMDKKKKIIFFNHIPAIDWIVASTVYEEEMFEPLTRLGWIILIIVCGAMGMVVPLCLYLGSLMTRPLARLAEQMHRAAEGEISIRAEEDALGEIGLVGHHFNRYLERLRQSNEKILTEIRERIQAEQQLMLYHKAFEHALEGIGITDQEGTLVAVNQAFCDITGYSQPELLGRNMRLLKSHRQDQSFYRQMWTSLRTTGRWTGEIWNRRKNGEIYPEILSISTIYDERRAVAHHVAVFHDITEMKRQEEQIIHQAYHDMLTGLPNRLLANDRIEVSIAHARRSGSKLAVLFLDLDNFKNTNDSLGHEWGDKLLLGVANRLVSQVREEDTVARLGGDEFLILVAALASEEVVIDLAKRLLRSLAAPFNIDDTELFVTVSIGVAFFPEDGSSAGILTKHADIAMYEAKARGKNRYCLFTSDLSERIVFLRQLENNLRQAVGNREFTVFFQPKIDPVNGTMTGAEALVRWRKEDGTIVNPADFIPLAEETGLIIPLGEQVLEQACHMLTILERLGRPELSIAVNLSPLQFVQNNLVERILAMLDRHGIAHDRLELEITETAMMTNLAKTVDTLNQLAGAGIAIAVDDFGTGYSSLSYLKRFPIRTLKIDRSFIRDLTRDPSDDQLVETIILMAHNLGIHVVAEGVESAEQLEWLKQRRCEQIQGYVCSRPLPHEAFLAFIERSVPVPGNRGNTILERSD